jgi:catechol 2,3-dioxygenase-like lactoylglutathione lyase family enzyme
MNVNLSAVDSQEDSPMSRVQLALNVADLDASIEFYTKLFGTEPAKIRDGYANFAIADPPLKLILFTGMGEPGSLNHIGVEVEDVEAVGAMIARANDLGMTQDIQQDVSCCFAVQDKTWVTGPDNDWEFYYVKGDAPAMSCGSTDTTSGRVAAEMELETVAAPKSECC